MQRRFRAAHPGEQQLSGGTAQLGGGLADKAHLLQTVLGVVTVQKAQQLYVLRYAESPLAQKDPGLHGEHIVGDGQGGAAQFQQCVQVLRLQLGRRGACTDQVLGAESRDIHLTADDVIFSYNECLANGKGNQHSALTGGMESIEKTGDYSIRFTWKRDSAGEFEDAMSKVLVVSQKAYEESGDCMRTKPVGTGPYYVKDWSTGTSLTLAKNENYWQKPELCGNYQKQNADEIVFYFVSEASQIAIGLETGSYDMNNTLNFTNASRFMEGGADAANFPVDFERDAFFQQIWVNRSEESPLHDLRIAQAVLYAIDQDGLIQAVAEGHGEKVYCYGSDINIGFQEKWKTEDYYNYNVDKAKELLADAGVAEGSLNLTILCDNDETRVKIAQVVKLYLAEVGINAEITSFDQALWNTYQTDPTKFDINISYNGGWGYITRTWNQLDSSRYEKHNMAMVRDDKLDNLIHTAQVSQDPADIDAAKQYMTEEAYHYGLFHKELYGITSNAKVTEAVYDYRGNLVPGACTYVWN